MYYSFFLYILFSGGVMYLISHRGTGDHCYAPNTKEAILSALQCDYISGVEFDVRMTNDHKLVVVHDPFIDLVSDGSGFVSRKTLTQLKQYNFGNECSYSHVSTLDEILGSISSAKKILIELKVSGKRYQKMMDVFYSVVSNYSYLNIYVCSFHKKALQYLMKKKMFFKVGILIGYALNDSSFYNHFDFILVRYSYLKKFNRNKETMFWTINDVSEFLYIKNLKEDVGVITDQSSLFQKYLP